MVDDRELTEEASPFVDSVSEQDVRIERRSVEWADGARYIHWVGLVLLGGFLVSLINVLPPKFTDPTWQLTTISLLIAGGTSALIGSLLVCLARLFNLGDRQVQKRSALVRTLASWVALGWLLLIPLQLYLGVRLINTQMGNEVGEIRTFERIARAVRNATTEDELRAAMAQVPNTPPLPRLTVPLEIAKANLLAQFQKTINAAKNRQDDGSSNRWQVWMKEAFRNSLQCLLLGLGFLAIGKNRLLDGASKSKAPQARSRARA